MERPNDLADSDAYSTAFNRFHRGEEKGDWEPVRRRVLHLAQKGLERRNFCRTIEQ